MTNDESKYKDICKDYKDMIKHDCNSIEKRKHSNKYQSKHYCEILENLYENCLRFKKIKQKLNI